MKYPVYQPCLIGNEKKYVDECLDTSWISSKGHFVTDFENNFAQYIGMKHGVAVFNGTVALHLALLSLGIKEGDEVIVPSFTYVASANPVVMVGATPVFVDSLMSSWQMDPEDIERNITSKTKAIIAPHMYGHPCDMDAICKICKDRGLKLVEDCAEAIGSKYHGKKTGSFGDISCFSFFGNKTITCGEGGMVLTNNDELYRKAANLKNQGLSPIREYWHDVVGYNYRMTNIQAAIGLAQLEHIEPIIKAKIDNANWYMEELAGLPVVFHKPAEESIVHTYWMCSILCVDLKTRDGLRALLKKNGVETRPTFPTIHRMPMYLKGNGSHFPIAEALAERGINLPSYPQLSREDVHNICNIIRSYFK